MLEELINNGIKLTVCKYSLFPFTFFASIPLESRKKSKEIIKDYCKKNKLQPKYFIDFNNNCLELELYDSFDAKEVGRECKFREALRKEVRELVKKRLLKVYEVDEFTTLYRPKNTLF